MLDYHDALAQLLAALPTTTATEDVALHQAAGRVLAQDLPAQLDAPAFDNSAMDGYALADPQGNCTRFALVGRIAAGDAALQPLHAGCAVRIFTGAPIPQGSTSVMPQEDARIEGDTLLLDTPYPAGRHIRRRAEEIAVGTTLLAAHTLLTPAAVALAASQGHATLPVLRKPRVMVFSSGKELRNPGQSVADPTAGHIYDANRYQLLAWLAALPVQVCDGGILPDDATITRERLQQAAQEADIILTSGGVSVGEEDHLKNACQRIGTLHMWKLAIKPGKPFAWGSVGAAHVFMLPGNPVATFVTFHQLVLPALRQILGLPQLAPWQGVAMFDWRKPQARREFLRVQVHPGGQNGQGWQVHLLPGQGSAMLSTCVQATALAELPPHTTLAAGDVVMFYPLSPSAIACACTAQVPDADTHTSPIQHAPLGA